MANRKSIKEKKVSGTYRADRDAGKTDLIWSKLNTAPPAPDHLSEYGRELWGRYCKELLDRDDLCAVYLPGLQEFVFACDIARRAALELNERMVTPSKANPAVKPEFRIWQQAVKTINDLSAQFGFSPKARLNLPGVSREPKDSSSLLR